MESSKRIYYICNLLKYRTVADIGTDHAYLPILAIKNNKIDKAIGIDINQGPLKSAESNIEKEGLRGHIELRKGYGLSPLKEGECDEAVIAGMGGISICKILTTHIQKALSFKRLILSPQSDAEAVRRLIHNELKWSIASENILKDNGKFYNIIVASPDSEYTDHKYTDYEYIFGKKLLDNLSEVFLEYLNDVLIKNQSILKNIYAGGKYESDKAIKLRKEICFIKNQIDRL